MASTSSSSAAALAQRNPALKAPAAAVNQPQGTFLPGTKVQVGSQRVTIEKYLSEGGFAHVYIVRVPRDNNKHEIAVLKRVAVPDKEHLASMRTEVETMKKLKGHKHVVTYMDSHASQLKGGGYEVFLLMEYCSGGGLIDFMNTRLQHRLTEPEILKIFGDCAEGVACMHYLKPPLLHRDLKVENVLISKAASSGSPMYKICDFGSAAPPRPAAKTAEEGRLIEEDVQKNTTMQYRSPEMIDVWRKQPIDEKADIWALGVFLYKLCYYTTPFEAVGQMAILNASFKYPPTPPFSERLKKLIGSMLKENPKNRPNIYQVIKEVSSMRGTEVPIKDIYAQRTHSEARRNESLPSPEPPMAIGLQKQAPQVQVESIPDITPMRRGRPTAPAQQAPVAASKPSPSPARGDPFAALDSKHYDVRAGAVDELSQRFPSLDQFSITHDKGEAFQFSQQPSQKNTESVTSKKPADLNVRVTNALADQVFKQTIPQTEIPKAQTAAQLQQPRASPTKSMSVQAKAREIAQQSPLVHQPTPVKPGVAYISTGTGTSPPPIAAKKQFPEISSRAIWRVPDHSRSSSQPRASEVAQTSAASLQPPIQKPELLSIHRSKSQTTTLNPSKAAVSSRPSLEGQRPSNMDLGGDVAISRTKSAQARTRPSSAYVSSNLDYLRDQETAKKRPSMEGRRYSKHNTHQTHETGLATDDMNAVDDDMDYLRINEDADKKKPHRMFSGHHKKRPSTHSFSGAAKHMIAGTFGEAKKKFEHHGPTEEEKEHVVEASDDDDDKPRLSSSYNDKLESITVVRGDADSTIDETEDLPPDVRRELERRRLSQEEKRVAAAAEEYRNRVAGKGTVSSGNPTQASTIQKRVQSLLDEGRQSPVQPKRTAEGYGRYTDNEAEVQHVSSTGSNMPSKAAPPAVARKPVMMPDITASRNPYQRTSQQQAPEPVLVPSVTAPPSQPATSQPRVVSRPSVPPKSPSLRTGGGSKQQQWPPPQFDVPQTKPASAGTNKPSGLAALLAKDLEGVPDYPPARSSGRDVPSAEHVGNAEYNDSAQMESIEDPSMASFKERYPNLSGIEMVETEISGGQSRLMTMKDV